MTVEGNKTARQTTELIEKLPIVDAEHEAAQEELRQLSGKLEALKAESEVLKDDRESLRIENKALKARVQMQLDTRATMVREIHFLWNSWSWRLFRPLRNFARRRRGLETESEPIFQSEGEALQTIIGIRQSLSWEMTAPLRFAHHILPLIARITAAGVKHLTNHVRPLAVQRGASRLQPYTSAAAREAYWDELIARGVVLPRRGATGVANQAIGRSKKPKIIFVSHDATRTGAPRILLSLMRHFALSERYELFVFCDGPGPLLEAFAEYGHVIEGSRHDFFQSSPRIVDLIEDFENGPPFLAICNTAQVNHYAQAFRRIGIPVVTLIHEMANRYPENHFRRIYEASDRVVFPANFVRDAANAKEPIPDGKALVIPQGLLDPEWAAGDAAEAGRSVRRQLGLEENSFIVLGCGTIDLRKGPDLFIGLAHKVLRLTEAAIHFVWMGSETSEASLAYFARKDIATLGIADKVHLIGERDAPGPFFQAADVFVLTSREDPFPCVVQEAMAAGTPVVAFDGAGGAREALADGSGIVVGYRDIDAMAEAVLELYRNPVTAARLAESAAARISAKYRFEDYYQALVRLARDELGVPLQVNDDEEVKPDTKSATPFSIKRDRRRRDFLSIKEDPDFDEDFFLSPSAARLARDDAIRLFVRESTGGTNARKPCPGFNPQSYTAEVLRASESDTRNPFAHFIESGKPSGRWLTEIIRGSAVGTRVTRLNVALHVHAYYPDLMEEFLRCLGQNASRCDLFVSTSRSDQVEYLRRRLKSYDKGEAEVSLVPNRGRDIGPFITEYKWLHEKYDLVGHLHCKKTPHEASEIGEIWRKFLWQNLLGKDCAMMDLIAQHFEQDPKLGLVFPDDPNMVGWWDNRRIAKDLARRMEMTVELPDAFEFPVGTMFWCRGQALRPLLELGLSWNDYPEEPLPIDGTILHAIERLLPFIAQDQGYGIAATSVPGLNR